MKTKFLANFVTFLGRGGGPSTVTDRRVNGPIAIRSVAPAEPPEVKLEAEMETAPALPEKRETRKRF
jgi:hypothetical protein